ncbi:hypothetical protein ACFFGH_30445 [Lysobacter korlensis]|uniref:Uncharacterized protein n=1 Tax=Lysobacter korlensis TaxID=553636 RepID=A0ABV6RYY3_9GAMM
MPPPQSVSHDDAPGEAGESYGAALVRGDHAALPAVIDSLRTIRFSGWIAPPAEGWIVVLGDPGDGVVAAGKRGIVEVAALLAESSGSPGVAVRVRRDRQLAIVAWRGAEEIGRYCSDPSREPGADGDILSEPYGAERAEGFAELLDRPDAAEDLAAVLEEELDIESIFESERLAQVLGLLGLPRWLVAAGALPHDIPTGPRAVDLIRLRGGAVGMAGRARGVAIHRMRRRADPPPILADPPRSHGAGIDPWLF